MRWNHASDTIPPEVPKTAAVAAVGSGLSSNLWKDGVGRSLAHVPVPATAPVHVHAFARSHVSDLVSDRAIHSVSYSVSHSVSHSDRAGVPIHDVLLAVA